MSLFIKGMIIASCLKEWEITRVGGGFRFVVRRSWKVFGS